MKFFTNNDLDTLIFFQVPKVLVLGERYRKMKPNALKLYMVLFDRMKLSIENGWKDGHGRFYVRMSQDGAADLFEWSPTTFRSMKKELEEFGLLMQVQEGQGKSNRLYIGKCEYDESDVYKVNKAVDTEMEENEAIAQTVDMTQKNKSCFSRRTTVDLLEEQQLTTNNNNFSNTDFNKTEENNIEDVVNKEPVTKVSKIDYDDVIHKLTNEYRSKGLSKEVCIRVVDEVSLKKDELTNFGGYLRGALENVLHKSKIRHGQIDPIKNMEERLKGTKVPFYDWLNDKDFNSAPGKITIRDDDLPF